MFAAGMLSLRYRARRQRVQRGLALTQIDQTDRKSTHALCSQHVISPSGSGRGAITSRSAAVVVTTRMVAVPWEAAEWAWTSIWA
jgi:hypothetical protein